MNVALLCGINQYPGNPLRGCLNDVESIRIGLQNLGFSPLHIRTLTDKQATKDNILKALTEMVERAQGGDHLAFSFSGHGSQIPCSDGDEQDGMDEIICPFGFDWETQFIRDDDLHEIISKLHADATLDVILDCCHSGTGLRDADDIVARFITPPFDTKLPPLPVNLMLRELEQENVALWAGCKSTQTSADDYIGGKYQGAMTYGLMMALSGVDLGQVSHGNKRANVHKKLTTLLSKLGYDQSPQLECSDEMREREIFT